MRVRVPQAHCDNDHYCCKQSKANQSLSKTILTLQQHLKKCRKQKHFLQEVNVSLMRDFDLKVKQAVEHQRDQAKKHLDELRRDFEAQVTQLTQSLAKAERDFEERLRKQTGELDEKVRGLEGELEGQREEGRVLRGQLAEAVERERGLMEEIGEVRRRSANDEETKRRLQDQLDEAEREKSGLLMKIQGQKVALKDIQQRYQALSQRLVKQQTQKRQAQIDVASKQSLVKTLQSQIVKHASIRDRLLDQNRALQLIANNLDNHVYDLRRKQFDMTRQLETAQGLAIRKSQALQGIKRQVNQLRYVV